MTYNAPELMLIGAAANLVLDLSIDPEPKCSGDDLPGNERVTQDEDAW